MIENNPTIILDVFCRNFLLSKTQYFLVVISVSRYHHGFGVTPIELGHTLFAMAKSSDRSTSRSHKTMVGPKMAREAKPTYHLHSTKRNVLFDMRDIYIAMRKRLVRGVRFTQWRLQITDQRTLYFGPPKEREHIQIILRTEIKNNSNVI